MTSSLQPSATDREFERLKKRVLELEKALSALTLNYRPETLYDFPGAIYESRSDRWRPSSTVTFADIMITLAEAGDDETVIVLLRNDDVVETFTIAGGARSLLVSISQTFSTGDEASFEVTTAGDGATGLLVAARHRV